MSLPPTTPEQREEIYEDVETLITVGFLTHPVRIGQTLISLRSLFPGDLHLLHNRSAHGYEWRFWIIAGSIWLVDGFNLLAEPHSAPLIAKTVRNIPTRTRDILFSISLGLFKRVGRALKRTEAFCYEGQSRYLWHFYGRRVPTFHTGIPGVERLGVNNIQGVWATYNQAEDDRINQDFQWESAKLIASSMSPKGVKKLDSKDKQRYADERARRQRVLDRAYYVSKGQIDDDGHLVGDPNKTLIHGASSPDELAEEMRRWVAGEEDLHDQIVSAYKRRVSAQIENERRAHQERMEALRRASEERSDAELIPRPLVGYTPDQLSGILQGRDMGFRGARRIYPEMDHRRHLYEKYLVNKPKAPQEMVLTEDGGLSPLGAEMASTEPGVDRGH